MSKSDDAYLEQLYSKATAIGDSLEDIDHLLVAFPISEMEHVYRLIANFAERSGLDVVRMGQSADFVYCYLPYEYIAPRGVYKGQAVRCPDVEYLIEQAKLRPMPRYEAATASALVSQIGDLFEGMAFDDAERAAKPKKKKGRIIQESAEVRPSRGNSDIEVQNTLRFATLARQLPGGDIDVYFEPGEEENAGYALWQSQQDGKNPQLKHYHNTPHMFRMHYHPELPKTFAHFVVKKQSQAHRVLSRMIRDNEIASYASREEEISRPELTEQLKARVTWNILHHTYTKIVQDSPEALKFVVDDEKIANLMRDSLDCSMAKATVISQRNTQHTFYILQVPKDHAMARFLMYQHQHNPKVIYLHRESTVPTHREQSEQLQKALQQLGNRYTDMHYKDEAVQKPGLQSAPAPKTQHELNVLYKDAIAFSKVEDSPYALVVFPYDKLKEAQRAHERAMHEDARSERDHKLSSEYFIPAKHPQSGRAYDYPIFYVQEGSPAYDYLSGTKNKSLKQLSAPTVPEATLALKAHLSEQLGLAGRRWQNDDTNDEGMAL